MVDLQAYLDRCRQAVNRELEGLLPEKSDPSRLMAAMAYSIKAGGKRVRPALCLAAAEAVGDVDNEIVSAACTIEMIHTYSLIHDDLPAMDDDDLRRGQPTCHVAFDEATAILAGDALLTLAFETLAGTALGSPKSPEIWTRVIQILAAAAGPRGMINGQMRDIAAEKNPLKLDELARMHALKTGAMIIASVEIGVRLGGGNREQVRRLREYAGHIGLAFQVMDDILNVTGDPQLMGKATGTDRERNKTTYPTLLGLEESRTFAGDLISKALQALDNFDNRSEPLKALANYIIARER
ncbi:MAG: polyprenyl synthetase family protein [Desulfobacterales bacterium]|nr:polyprenyl synthetase family protein [Desulfobacterales bacterium]